MLCETQEFVILIAILGTNLRNLFGHPISTICNPIDHGLLTRNPVPDLPQVLCGRYPRTLNALLLHAMQNG